MSSFNPNVPAIPRATHEELLDRFAPAALRRPSPLNRPMNPFRLTLTGLLTAGWYPCRLLQTRIRNLCVMQERQLDLAADMLARWAPTDEIKQLRESYEGSQSLGYTGRISQICLLGSMLLAVLHLTDRHWTQAAVTHFWFQPPEPWQSLAIASVALLFAAYLLLWARVNQMVLTLDRFALAFNAMNLPNTPPLESPALVWGIRPLFLLIGCVFAWFGLFWGLPMLLAWAAFVTFVGDRSYVFRVAIADRLQGLSGVEPVISTKDLCPNPKCRSPLPGDATYCPRCGTELCIDELSVQG